MLKEFRKGTVAFHALIRRLRVRMLSEDIGVGTTEDRQAEIVAARQCMEQYVDVQDRAKVKWLTEARHIARHIFKEGMEGDTLKERRENARNKWEEDVKYLDIRRRVSGGKTELAVGAALAVIGTRGTAVCERS